jgi:hypothetical protein
MIRSLKSTFPAIAGFFPHHASGWNQLKNSWLHLDGRADFADFHVSSDNWHRLRPYAHPALKSCAS